MSIDNFIVMYKSKAKPTIKNKFDFEEYIKLFNGFKKSDKIKLSSFVIAEWKKNKYKVKTQDELIVLKFYLDEIYKLNYNDINIKNQFSIKIYDNKINETIRCENIFKLDMNNIVKNISKKYKNIRIIIKFEEATSTQLQFLEKQFVYHHDAIIEILDNNKIESIPYVIALEYLEKNSHNSTKDKIYDDKKKIISELMCDSYFEYRENIDNYDEFIEKVTFELIKYICTINDDEEELCKYICAIKNNRNQEIFNRMLSIKKENKFSKKNFFEDIKPENEDIETQKDFYNKIEEEYNIDANKTDYETFEKIIINCDPDHFESENLRIYKNMLSITFNGLLNASRMITELIKKERNKRINIPDLVLYHSKLFCYNEETKKLKSK